MAHVWVFDANHEWVPTLLSGDATPWPIACGCTARRILRAPGPFSLPSRACA